jgi:hypothetical protein
VNRVRRAAFQSDALSRAAWETTMHLLNSARADAWRASEPPVHDPVAPPIPPELPLTPDPPDIPPTPFPNPPDRAVELAGADGAV